MLSYTFTFTDQNPLTEFTVQPYVTNGTVNPTSTTLHPNALSANTSLLFIGKGFPEYGDLVQENILHLLENFSSPTAPVYPVPGQLWFNSATNVLNICTTALTWAVVETSSVADNTYVNLTGDTMTGLLVLSADPSVNLGAATKQYVDTGLSTKQNTLAFTPVDKAGDTMTGLLVLSADPSVNLGAATKQYVDNSFVAVTNVSYVNVIDPTITYIANMVENQFASDPTYPVLLMKDVVDNFSKLLGKTESSYKRFLVTTTGGTIYTIPGLSYIVGHNRLSVTISGIKQYVSEAAITQIISINTPPTSYLMYPSMKTGLLNDATVYSCMVSVNGSLPSTLNIIGQNCQTFYWLVYELNLFATTNFVNVTFFLENGILYVISDVAGNGSNVSVTDINLFSAIVGDITYPITIPSGPWTSLTVLTDLGYRESGKYGKSSDTIIFSTGPGSGNLMEIIAIPSAYI